MHCLQLGAQVVPLAFAIEGRSKDEKAYIYFDVQVFKAQDLIRAKRKPEQFVEDRGAQWMERAGDGAQLSEKSSGATHYNDRFGQAKGVGYRFNDASG